MDNTRAWGHNSKVVEGFRAPLKELEALTVTFEFHLLIELSSIKSASLIDLNGVINNKIDRAQWVDLLGITTETVHAVSHSS